MPFPRSGTFHSGTFHSGTFRPGSFRSGTFRPGSFRSGTFPASAFCSAAALLFCVFAAPRGRGMLVREGKTHVWEGKVPRLSEKEGDGARWGRQGARPGGRLPARPGVWLSARQGREGRWVGRKSGSDRCGTVRPVGEGTRLPGLPCVANFRRKGACGAGVEAR